MLNPFYFVLLAASPLQRFLVIAMRIPHPEEASIQDSGPASEEVQRKLH
jgi:hypothetical protein